MIIPRPCKGIEKPWNMIVTVTPIVIGFLGKDTKGLVKGPGDLEIRVETIQTTALLRLARILGRVQETYRRIVDSQTPVKDHHFTQGVIYTRQVFSR